MSVDTTQLLKGVLDLAVLDVLAAGDSYGYEIVTHLREHGLDAVGEASVYGTLRRLQRDELLDTYLQPSDSGPSRRYYHLTDVGEDRLETLAKTWRRFVEIMDSLLEDPQ